jgi:hypothetical protein
LIDQNAVPILVLGAVLVLFGALSEAARRGRRWAHLGAVAVAGVLLAVGALLELGGFIGVVFDCHESCASAADGSADWWDTRDAWQWWGQLGAFTLGLAALAAALLFTVRRRERPATALMAAAIAVYLGWGLPYWPE